MDFGGDFPIFPAESGGDGCTIQFGTVFAIAMA